MTQTPRIYLYDGSFEGLLSAVAIAVKESAASGGSGAAGVAGKSVTNIISRAAHRPALFEEVKEVASDAAQAQRLLDYLNSLSSLCRQMAINGYLSESADAGIHLYHFVRLCLRHGPAAAGLHSHDSVRCLELLRQKVSYEAHRFNGLIRFRILEDGLQYSPFEPDHNVIGFCAAHFRSRLANRRWILHDVRRNFALYWPGTEHSRSSDSANDKGGLRPVEIDEAFTRHVQEHGELPDEQLTEEEQYYQGLWRSFHLRINNPDRENLQLQRQLMPRRYWKYLTEM